VAPGGDLPLAAFLPAMYLLKRFTVVSARISESHGQLQATDSAGATPSQGVVGYQISQAAAKSPPFSAQFAEGVD